MCSHSQTSQGARLDLPDESPAQVLGDVLRRHNNGRKIIVKPALLTLFSHVNQQ